MYAKRAARLSAERSRSHLHDLSPARWRDRPWRSGAHGASRVPPASYPRLGIGPIISRAMVAAIGTGDVFSKGRDLGAWLGLVPKQISTADRTILGSISKRGNRYLRALFVPMAWVVLVKLQSIGRAMGSSRGARQRRSDCTTTCPPLRWPTSSHRLGGSQQGARLRVRQDRRCDGVPTNVVLAPCSRPSRRSLAAWTREVGRLNAADRRGLGADQVNPPLVLLLPSELGESLTCRKHSNASMFGSRCLGASPLPNAPTPSIRRTVGASGPSATAWACGANGGIDWTHKKGRQRETGECWRPIKGQRQVWACRIHRTNYQIR
jgi:hypothetical protein